MVVQQAWWCQKRGGANELQGTNDGPSKKHLTNADAMPGHMSQRHHESLQVSLSTGRVICNFWTEDVSAPFSISDF
jgi:hypothetical protein